VKTTKEPLFLLSSIPYRDSDLVVNLLSSQHGKLSSVIYSGRKIGKTSSFLFQPGDLLEVEYQVKESNDFVKVINISSIATLSTDKFSYNRFLFHSYLLEVISKISQPGNPSDDLFNILLTNNQCKWKKEKSFYLIGRMIWMLTQHGGFGIDYHTCGKCQRPTMRFNESQTPSFRKENYQFSSNSGALLCDNCTPVTDPEELITPSMLKVMWTMDTDISDHPETVTIPDSIMIEVILCLNRYLIQQYEIKPKSLSLFLGSLKASP